MDAQWLKATIHGLLAILALLDASAGAHASIRFEAGGALLYGPLEGSLQTPLGGELSTTSHNRPTLHELGFEQATMMEFWMNVRWAANGLYFGGRLIRLDGSSVLETDLLSRGRTFPAGSPVESDIKLDWYRFGYGRWYPWKCRDRTIEFFPSIGVALLTFEYQLSSPVAGPIDRGYSKGGVQFGLGVTAPITDRLSIIGQTFLPIALSNTPDIISLQLTAKHQFLKLDDLQVTGLLGAGYDRIHYRDDQLVPNDIEANVGPMSSAGLEALF